MRCRQIPPQPGASGVIHSITPFWLAACRRRRLVTALLSVSCIRATQALYSYRFKTFEGRDIHIECMPLQEFSRGFIVFETQLGSASA